MDQQQTLSSLEALLRQFGRVSRSRGKNGLELVTTCPFCRGKGKLYVNPAMGMYLCQKCRDTGTTEKLVGLKIQGFIDQGQPLEPLPDSTVFPGTMQPLLALSSDNPAIGYLERRGFDPIELDQVFGVRYCDKGRLFGGRFNTTNTIILPVWMEGRVLGWQARLLYNPDVLTDNECATIGLLKDEDGDWVKPPKYFTSPGLSKGRVLYNFDVARKSRVVVITEGPFDAIAVGQCGVATLGKGVAENQINLVKSYWDLAVILLDPGDADKEAMALTYTLKAVMPTVWVQLEGYKDAGECPRKEIWRQIGEQALKQGVDITRYPCVI